MADINRARALRKRRTWAEKLMWRWLRDRQFSGYKFRREHPLGKCFLDFFCEEARLSMELDGFQEGTRRGRPTTPSGKNSWFRVESRPSVFGIVNCGPSGSLSAITFSMPCNNGRLIRCPITPVRAWSLGREAGPQPERILAEESQGKVLQAGSSSGSTTFVRLGSG